MTTFGVYKNEWASSEVDPFTTIKADKMLISDGAFCFYQWNEAGWEHLLIAAYPLSAFYVVVLED